MRIVMFYHSLISDWNHGNAHFLRGVVSELLARGHDVTVYEPRDSWSLANLVQEQGRGAVEVFHRAFPALASARYVAGALDLDSALNGADLVLVHEWNDPALVAAIGAHRARSRDYRLLFHDTHHRAATAPGEMARFDLTHYDGVLAFGDVIRDIYIERGWTDAAWTWHEAADTRVFQPIGGVRPGGDLVWIGNWGDDERNAELREYLIEPVRALRLNARVHGVRYPDFALAELRSAGIAYGGWIPNHEVPRVFAAHRVTVHVPRRPYARALPGVPTIRVFEALACGIPLISAPWEDTERLFSPGRDFLVARSGAEMRDLLNTVLNEPGVATQLALNGLRTITERHTCAHRVDELLVIYRGLEGGRRYEGTRSLASPVTQSLMVRSG